VSEKISALCEKQVAISVMQRQEEDTAVVYNKTVVDWASRHQILSG
jgi:hypothetical protein